MSLPQIPKRRAMRRERRRMEDRERALPVLPIYHEEDLNMSIQSQEKNMRKLAGLLGRDLSDIRGEREDGPNGDKKVFLNTGKAFLRALARDLAFMEYKVSANPGGIAVSGDCTLIGMWADSGLYVQLSQPCYQKENVLLYRTVCHIKDYSGGRNQYITRRELESLSYKQFLDRLADGICHERAA